MEKKNYGNGFYKKQAMKFEQLNPDSLAALYMNRNQQKRVIIDEFLEELETIRDTYIEEAIDASELKDAKEVLKYIMEKK